MTKRRRQAFTVAAVLSLGAHGLFVAALSTAWRQSSVKSQHVAVVEVVPPDERPPAERWTVAPAPSPRVGTRRAACPTPALDALAPRASLAGLHGKQPARPRRDSLSASDFDELRFRPYDHRDRDTPLRQAGSRRPGSEDNRESRPDPGKWQESAAGRGKAPLSKMRARAGATLAPRPGPSSPSPARAYAPQRARSGQFATQQANPSRGKTSGERLSRAPLEDENAPRRQRPHSEEDVPHASHRTPGSTRDRQRQARASKQRISQRVDMARPSDRGAGRGKRAGAVAGRRGSPAGKRRGLPIWLHTRDRRYVHYFRRIYAKIQPLWRFPKALELRLEQGEVLLEFVVESDGGLRSVEVRRSSGYRRFDRNAVAAVRAASPFEPIPAHLGARELRILAPFEFSNPLVR